MIALTRPSMAKVALEISTSTKMPAAYAVCCAVAAARSRRRLMTPTARKNAARQNTAIMKNGEASIHVGRNGVATMRTIEPM